MSAANPAGDERINQGFIVHRKVAAGAAQGGRTFIVTGLQRSGTSLVASILRQVGIFMGSQINDSVHEDEEMAKILNTRGLDGLRQRISERDAGYGTWGFKFPMLCDVLDPEQIALFTNPHLIVPFRDPVAIAVRKSLSDYQAPLPALRSAETGLAAMTEFVERVAAPALLLSYEKALVFPAGFVDALMRFCDLPRNDAVCRRLVRLIEPNRKAYIDVARRNFDGVVDGVSDGFLCGWSRLTASAEPVVLDLLLDDRKVATFAADLFRQDLRDAGYGTGHHGFRLDLRRFGVGPEAMIRVRVASHGASDAVELGNSGRRLADYG